MSSLKELKEISVFLNVDESLFTYDELMGVYLRFKNIGRLLNLNKETKFYNTQYQRVRKRVYRKGANIKGTLFVKTDCSIEKQNN